MTTTAPYTVTSPFKVKGVLQTPGTILQLSPMAAELLAGFVAPVAAARTACRACGSTSFREGINGHRSCSKCNVPEHPFVGKRRKK